LTGSNLFLAVSIAAGPEFENVTEVPPDFTGTQLSVPHPVGGVLYLKLRDDPATVQTLTLPVTFVTQPMQQPAVAMPLPQPAATAPETPQKAEPQQSSPLQ
jgi:hypothetical protein